VVDDVGVVVNFNWKIKGGGGKHTSLENLCQKMQVVFWVTKMDYKNKVLKMKTKNKIFRNETTLKLLIHKFLFWLPSLPLSLYNSHIKLLLSSLMWVGNSNEAWVGLWWGKFQIDPAKGRSVLKDDQSLRDDQPLRDD